MDVVAVFLNGNLQENIYMQQSDEYTKAGNEQLICKLKKPLHGLKHSPICWNTVFNDYLKSLKFEQSAADPCVYVKDTDSLTIVAVYVDDLIVVANTYVYVYT